MPAGEMMAIIRALCLLAGKLRRFGAVVQRKLLHINKCRLHYFLAVYFTILNKLNLITFP